MVRKRSMFTANQVLFGVVVFFALYYIYKSREGLENTKTVTNLATCSDCTIWNSRDASAKCDKLCKINNPDKGVSYTGNWTTVGKGASCECSFEGAYKKQFIGCPTSNSLGTSDCFFWNNNDAKTNCQYVCDKFLPGKGSKWTGQWKNTSANTSACECEYYD